MRKLLNYMLIIALFIPYSFGSENTDYFEDGYARMSYVKGDVFIQRAEDLGYEEGVVNLALIQGDKIGTREGRTEIHLGEGNYIRIDRNTQIELVKMPDRSENTTGIHLLSGNIFLRVNFLSDEKFMEVHTPDASLYILEQGLYYLASKQSQQTEIRIFEGRAEAAGEEGSLLLKAEEKLIVSNGRFITNPTYFYDSMNSSFAEWNSSRDAFHSRYAVGTRYLPSELSEYEAELDYYGQWRYHNSYGYVWIPSGISVSWRPYYHGRWVWYPIIGWTWVSYEPWGWCVSHYGRWHWSVGFGWYWIPTSRWGPAWVHWYRGRHHIGWCPLSYYGYPGVVINNHYYGNYYHNYYPSGSRALTVVHKNQLQARNVSKVALSESRVSKLSQISLSSVQPKIKPIVDKTHIRSSEAAQLFSKTNSRRVTKAYSGSRTLNSSPRSAVSTKHRSSDIKKDSITLKRQAKTTQAKNSRAGLKRTFPSRSSGVSKTRSTLTTGKVSNTRRGSHIKTYPSREIRSVAKSSSHSRSVTNHSAIGNSKRSISTNNPRSSKQSSRIKRYPSRTSSRSRLSSSRNFNSAQRKSIPKSRTRNKSSSSIRSSIRNRSVPSISRRANSRLTRSRRTPASRSRIRSSSPSRIRSSSSSRIRSRPKVRSSSTRIRSSSSRARTSSSAKSRRTSRTKSSSRSRSTKRVKKK